MAFFKWFISLDPSVQVAVIGLLGGSIAGVIGIFKELTKKDEDKDDIIEALLPHTVTLDTRDANLVERLILAIETLAENMRQK